MTVPSKDRLVMPATLRHEFAGGGGKPFQMMTYPDRTHSISEKPGTTLHPFPLITRYLEEKLPAGGR